LINTEKKNFRKENHEIVLQGIKSYISTHLSEGKIQDDIYADNKKIRFERIFICLYINVIENKMKKVGLKGGIW